MFKIFAYSYTFVFRLGSDPEKLFPFELMQDHFQKFGKFGMIMAAMLLPMLTATGGHSVDIDSLCDGIKEGKDIDAEVFISDESRQRLVNRLRGVVIDMVHLGYI